jgi:hypothetical protein
MPPPERPFHAKLYTSILHPTSLVLHSFLTLTHISKRYPRQPSNISSLALKYEDRHQVLLHIAY